MITEIAILYIKTGESDAFEKAFSQAQQLMNWCNRLHQP